MKVMESSIVRVSARLKAVKLIDRRNRLRLAPFEITFLQISSHRCLSVAG